MLQCDELSLVEDHIRYDVYDNCQSLTTSSHGDITSRKVHDLQSHSKLMVTFFSYSVSKYNIQKLVFQKRKVVLSCGAFSIITYQH